MECELCYKPYDFDKEEGRIPKVIKSCPHTYCSQCLLGLKERFGKAACPICSLTQSLPEQDEFPNNEQLLRALEHKKSEQKAIVLMNRYEILNPQFEQLLLSKIGPKETVVRKRRPYELKLSEITHTGELVYIENMARSLNAKSPLFFVTNGNRSPPSS